MLPLRDGGTPHKSSGTELLNDIVQRLDIRKPTHIVCLTEYPNLAEVLDSPIQLSLTHIVEFDDLSHKWREVLCAKCKYILQRLKDADVHPAEFLADVAIVTSSPTVELTEVLQEVERTQAGVSEFMKEWRGQRIDWVPRLILGVMATGAAVVQSEDLVNGILKTSRKTLGLEMEAYGVFQAATLAREPRPRVLISKSVSDFANHRKSDDWQQLAAFTSARFVHHLVTHSKDLRL
jgi:hypothetical protein